jgi:hypothetical protein
MKVYVLEPINNIEICEYLKERRVYVNNLTLADVVIVDKALNIRKSLDIVDIALMSGKEIICFKNEFARENYVSNYLIKDGAKFI